MHHFKLFTADVNSSRIIYNTDKTLEVTLNSTLAARKVLPGFETKGKCTKCPETEPLWACTFSISASY